MRITPRERRFLLDITRRHGLSLQHEILCLSCWWRCSPWFSSDEDVANLVMRVVVYLVTRYLGPREHTMETPRPDYLKRVYYRAPGDKAFIDSPTINDVIMAVFLTALDGRIR